MSGDAVGRLRAAAERVIAASPPNNSAQPMLFVFVCQENAPALAAAVLALTDTVTTWPERHAAFLAAAALLPDDAP